MMSSTSTSVEVATGGRLRSWAVTSGDTGGEGWGTASATKPGTSLPAGETTASPATKTVAQNAKPPMAAAKSILSVRMASSAPDVDMVTCQRGHGKRGAAGGR